MHPSHPILAPTIRGYIFFLGWWSVRSLFTHIYNGFSVCLTTQNHFSLPYTHLRLLSFVHRPFLLFTRCPCSRGNVTMTNFLLPGRLLQVCTISNSPMFYLLLFCNLKFERFYFQAHTPVAFPFLHPRTPHNNTPHNTQPVLVVLCRDGGHIFPEVNGVAWRT